MKIAKLKENDISEFIKSIKTLNYSGGSIDFNGQFRRDHIHPESLYMFVGIESHTAEEVWINNCIHTKGEINLLSDLLESETQKIYLQIFKFKTGIFSRRCVLDRIFRIILIMT